MATATLEQVQLELFCGHCDEYSEDLKYVAHHAGGRYVWACSECLEKILAAYGDDRTSVVERRFRGECI